MKVAIVGSRNFPSPALVQELVESLNPDDVVVSGGARGVDTWAAEAARKRGLQVIEHPIAGQFENHFAFCEAAYARNQRIVDEADILHAFTDQPKGGTWDTIGRAKKKGIRVLRHRSQGLAEPLQNQAVHHCKRAGLGVFAIHRGNTYPGAQAVAHRKQYEVHALGQEIAQDVEQFLGIFPLGYFGAIVPAPRSRRNLDNLHPVTIACQMLGERLRLPVFDIFEPTEKQTRGVRADCAEVRIDAHYSLAGVKHTPVLLIDDVATTCRTMSQAMQALVRADSHPRGLIWLML